MDRFHRRSSSSVWLAVRLGRVAAAACRQQCPTGDNNDWTDGNISGSGPITLGSTLTTSGGDRQLGTTLD